MNSILEIIHVLLPLIVVAGIAVFVVMRMKHKYKKGTLAKMKTKSAQTVLDSLIPLGMLLGCTVAILFSLFLSISLIATFSWGAGLGLLFGYVAYEIYSRQRESYYTE